MPFPLLICCNIILLVYKTLLYVWSLTFNHRPSIPGYLHQVRSYGRGISYTIQFAPVLDFKAIGCKEESKSKRRKKGKKDVEEINSGKQEEDTEEKEDAEEKSKEDNAFSLSDVEFVWAYSDGERVNVYLSYFALA